jgi:hypothetical protein
MPQPQVSHFMISFAEPGLTEDLNMAQKEEYTIACHMRDTYTSLAATVKTIVRVTLQLADYRQAP